MRTAKPECAAVQGRDRRSEAEAKSGTRQRAAGFQAHETFDRMPVVALGNARSMSGDAKQPLVALAPRLDQNFPGASNGVGAERLQGRRRLAVLDRVLDEIGERLADQFPGAVPPRRRGGLAP